MAGFLNNLLGNTPEKKLRKEIEGTEFKKQSLITPLLSEMNTAKQRIDEELRQIGLSVYEAHVKGEVLPEEELKAKYDTIGTHKTFAAEKEAKIAEFTARYDEEISILKSSLEAMLAPSPPAEPQLLEPEEVPEVPESEPSAEVSYCSNCGTAYKPKEDIFCTHCGNKVTNA